VGTRLVLGRPHIADVHRLAGRPDEADAIYRDVLAFTRRELPLPEREVFFALDTGVDQLQPWALHGLALLALHRGDPQAALEWASQVDPNVQVRAERHPDLSARFDVKALALAELGRLDEAAAVLERFEPIWTQAYANGVYKGVYGPLARAELARRGPRPEDACAALLPAQGIDPGMPAQDKRRLDTALESCARSQDR
jgi:tetratricopeptide (TPR) repeat protein